ncbi:MAG: histidine kinase [Ruminococcus sp.]|nr:histidine kinase [Ruminococcus sp.]
MKSKNKKRRLLFQITAIVLPLFLLLAVVICQQVYSNSVDSFLEAQNTFMEEHLDNSEKNFFLFEEEYDNDDLRGWYIDYLEKKPDEAVKPLTEEEENKMDDYFNSADLNNGNYYLNTPEDIRELYIRRLYSVIEKLIYFGDNYDSLFVIDVSEGCRGYNLLNINKRNKNDSKKTGEYYDIDINDHPAIKKAIESDSPDYTFERNDDFPTAGSNYIGCKPIKINGKTRVIIGITYNWDALHSSLHSTIIRTMIISVGGMLLVMGVIILLLYRRAVKPAEKIQKALIGYTADKDTEQIVEKMQEIKENNELGYLAGTVSDLAVEIETYTKQVAQIASERERAEKELYEAKVAVMTSQIQPHFMYNALTSIAMMCQIDPETAQEATVTFAKYLRGNMDSLKQTKPVPFETELEHLKKYLYIEKLRFGKKLNVEYDIRATDFCIPMLSVQPLVENAVKHGVGMKKKGGTVTISTRETDSAFEVIISDNGVGFDTSAPKADDGRSHVGMENTRSRLKQMCGGEITIQSTVGEGTTATITLPKEEQHNEDTVS